MEQKLVYLLYLCSATGLIMVVGGIFLIYKEKIYIDSQTKKVTEFDTPIGKFKTNAPALALFVIGFIPLIYPVYEATKLKNNITLKGEVSGNEYPIQVYVILKSQSLNNSGKYVFTVPANSDNGHYKLLYMAGDTVSEDVVDLGDVTNGMVNVKDRKLHNPVVSASYVSSGINEVPDEFRN